MLSPQPSALGAAGYWHKPCSRYYPCLSYAASHLCTVAPYSERSCQPDAVWRDFIVMGFHLGICLTSKCGVAQLAQAVQADQKEAGMPAIDSATMQVHGGMWAVAASATSTFKARPSNGVGYARLHLDWKLAGSSGTLRHHHSVSEGTYSLRPLGPRVSSQGGMSSMIVKALVCRCGY